LRLRITHAQGAARQPRSKDVAISRTQKRTSTKNRKGESAIEPPRLFLFSGKCLN
jgi:hypothetical protein